jgi:pimeloyl-ACP methyl ester carboxylesterase
MAGPTIVLVHGAFADASSFRPLYDRLLEEDVTILAPPNPLRGLTGGDGEYIKKVVGEIDGPVLLVGHSYGGSVITAAGAAENVVGLVYISGFAPDEGENLTDLQSKFPAPAIIPYIREHELPEGAKEFTAGAPAWRSRPVWAVLGTADRCIDPGVHRFSYERMGAKVTEIEGASHVVMVSHPKEVADVVMTAVHSAAMQPA